MQTELSAQPSPLARDDTLLGVCQALGEDFGFNPIWLRLALGVSLLWNPAGVIAAYLAAAIVLAALHWIVPSRRAAKASAGEAAAMVAAQAAPAGDNDEEAMAAAA